LPFLASLFLFITKQINNGGLIAWIIISILFSSAFKIADQWEKAVVLRMGKFVGLKGPGLFIIIPIIDRISGYTDQRVRNAYFKAEETLTKDTVPVNVDAVVYWTIWDVEKAVLEVQDYLSSVLYIAQAALRAAIGKHDLADLLQLNKTSANQQTSLLIMLTSRLTRSQLYSI